MPLYEYQCEACGTRFERIQRFSDPLVDTCPSCGGSVKKLLSSPAIQFKGSGWYITDYARKGESAKKESPKADAASAPSTDSSSSSGTAKSDAPKTTTTKEGR